MSDYVLDTNVVSALMKGDPRAIARLRSVKRNRVVLPQPVVAEIEYGIERLARSKRKQHLRDRIRLLCEEIPRCTWTDEVSSSFGTIKATLERKGTRIEDFDAAIAAHALATDAVLVTANVGHMVRVPGLLVEDWCAEAPR